MAIVRVSVQENVVEGSAQPCALFPVHHFTYLIICNWLFMLLVLRTSVFISAIDKC